MTLSKDEIIKRLNPKQKMGQEPIVVTPLLNQGEQIGNCGIDLRLGKQFLMFNDHIQNTFDPSDNSTAMSTRKFQDEIIVPLGEYIILHPGTLLMASTFEYVSIPWDLECQVEGRSSWARLGLIIATATTVEPGYKGIITLELSNTGKIPIKLFPGLRIAQIIFHSLEDKIASQDLSDKHKYNYSIGPGTSKIFDDPDIEYFCKK